MARTGPPPPDPNWTRLDERGNLSTRYAWGYISPDEKAIVKDDGSIYMLIDQDELEKKPRQKAYHARFIAGVATLLGRCLRWSKIVSDMYEFEEEPVDFTEKKDDVIVLEPKKEMSKHRPRRPRPEDDWNNLGRRY
jgi:hypothetical protein